MVRASRNELILWWWRRSCERSVREGCRDGGFSHTQGTDGNPARERQELRSQGQAQPHRYSAEVKDQLNKEKLQIKEESARARIHVIKWWLWKWWRNCMTSCVMPGFQGFRFIPGAWSPPPVCLVQTQINFKMKENQPILLILSCGKNPVRVCVYITDGNQTSEVQIILIIVRKACKVQVSAR